MRIGLVIPDMDPLRSRGGGIARYGENLAAALLKEGHELHVFTRRPPPRRPSAAFKNLVVHAVSARSRRSALIAASCGEDLGWSFALSEYLVRRARGLRLDVLEGTDLGAPLYFLQSSRISAPGSFRTPIVLRLHGLGREMRGYGHGNPRTRAARLLDRAEAFSVGAADGLIGTSRFIRKNVARRLGIRASAIPVILLPAGAAEEPAERGRRRAGRILYVGRLESRKGADLLVKAALPWLRRFPRLEVRLIGSDTLAHKGGSMLAHLRRLIPAADRARFRFLGTRGGPALREEFRSCAFTVVPSRFDNLPYACLEAMSFGSPVIATRASGLSEIVEHGRSGLLCAPEVGALSRAVGRMLSLTPGARAAMGARAARRVRGACGPERVARAQVEFYRAAVRGGRRPAHAPLRPLDIPSGGSARPAADLAKARQALELWKKGLRKAYDG